MITPDMHFDFKIKKTVIAGLSSSEQDELKEKVILGLHFMKDNTFTVDVSVHDELIKSINEIPNIKDAIKIFEALQLQYFKKVVTKKEEYEN